MKYLPIGTVVTLVNGTKPIMIYGRKQIQEGSKNTRGRLRVLSLYCYII